MSDTTDKSELIAQYSQLPLDSKYMRLVAHDVRNRMNTIMMASDILREELEKSKNDPQKYVNMINRASEDVLIILDAAVAALAKRDDASSSEIS